jgi:hypothetical protein
MGELRLGDIIDDYCVKCKRITNHAIVAMVNGVVAKVRCSTCYNEHPFRNCEAPPSKKDLKKKELFDQVLGKSKQQEEA